jgi:hypothetical protein
VAIATLAGVVCTFDEQGIRGADDAITKAVPPALAS